MANPAALPEHCRSLFLGDLSCYCQEKDIYNAFIKYGDIESIRLMRGKENKPLGYGFITFVDIQATLDAQEMDGFNLLGRPLKVGWANVRSPLPKPVPMKKPQKKEVPHPEGAIQSAQIHFSYITKHTTRLINEATIRSVFAPYGEIKDICIKKSINKGNGEQNGYGFIHYPLTTEGIESAIRATNAIRQKPIDKILYDSCLTRSLEMVIRQQNRSTSFSTTSTDSPITYSAMKEQILLPEILDFPFENSDFTFPSNLSNIKSSPQASNVFQFPSNAHINLTNSFTSNYAPSHSSPMGSDYSSTSSSTKSSSSSMFNPSISAASALSASDSTYFMRSAYPQQYGTSGYINKDNNNSLSFVSSPRDYSHFLPRALDL